jgi:ABC-2 type transport system permease protein
MMAYRAIISARCRTLLQYRAAAAAGFGTQLFWGLIRVMIFDAFYRSSTAAQPMARHDVVTYIWLGQAMLVMLPWNVEPEVQALIRSGNVAYELLRPVRLYWLWFTRALAYRTAPMIMRALPMFIVAMLFFGMKAPPSFASLAAWIAATVGAAFLVSAITTLVMITMLWTIAGTGVWRLTAGMVIVFSGMAVPLPLFPDWAQTALTLLPFRGFADAPFRLYVGHIAPEGVFAVLALQLVWTLAFVVVGQWVLSRGVLRLVVQGG